VQEETQRYEKAIDFFKTALKADRLSGFNKSIVDDLAAIGSACLRPGKNKLAVNIPMDMPNNQINPNLYFLGADRVSLKIPTKARMMIPRSPSRLMIFKVGVSLIQGDMSGTCNGG